MIRCPPAATALGRGLGGDSTIATQGERKQGTVWPAFEERTFTAYRAYFRYVPKGPVHRRIHGAAQ